MSLNELLLNDMHCHHSIGLFPFLLLLLSSGSSKGKAREDRGRRQMRGRQVCPPPRKAEAEQAGSRQQVVVRSPNQGSPGGRPEAMSGCLNCQTKG